MPVSNVPSPTLGPNGFVAPSAGAVLSGVQADIDAAFGGGVNPSLTTPQGQIATTQTAIINDKNAQFLALANGVDPAYASGRMQDAIGRIYFLERTPAEATTVTATCSGLTGAVIPLGSLAQATDGNIYASTAAGTIGVGGTVDIPFQCTVTGPVICTAGSLSAIYKAVPGWDSVTNVADGVVGNDVESRAEFEARRAASVALNARGSIEAVRAAVLNVPNVLDAYVTDNSTGSPVTTGGVTLAAHSLYVCVSGGATADVAQAIWSKKDPGCAYNGSTTVTVYDTSGGYAVPPAYSVSFQIAAPLTVEFTVDLATNPFVPADAATQVTNALLSAFAGGDGGSRVRIGVSVFASRYYAPILALGSWVEIKSIKLTGAADSVTVDIDQIPVTSASDITVTVT